jgi:hypothetical protein
MDLIPPPARPDALRVVARRLAHATGACKAARPLRRRDRRAEHARPPSRQPDFHRMRSEFVAGRRDAVQGMPCTRGSDMTVSDFTDRAQSQTGPASLLRPVVPDDAADLPDGAARSLFVGGGGALAVVDISGRTATILSAPYQYHPIRVRRVLATGTTATAILALY